MSDDGNHKHDDQRDDRAMAYLYWTPTDRIAASLELIGEHYSAKKRDNPTSSRVRTLTAPLQLTYTHRPDGSPRRDRFRGAGCGSARRWQRPGDLDSHGVLVDLAAGYRLPKRRGIIALEVTNLLDQHLAFQDESFRTQPRKVNPRFMPSRMFLATLTLNF